MYEQHRSQPLSRSRFLRRFAGHLALALGLVAFSLGTGMLGYAYFEGMRWLDAFVNAAMLLSGMGPVDPIKTDGGKIFAGLYALYCGVVFLVVAGVLFAPLLHRILHRFHWDREDKG